MKLNGICVVLDSNDSETLSDFYQKLLGWTKVRPNPDYLLVFDSENQSRPWLLFQDTPDYERPCWPAEPSKQQQMTHLDFLVDDLESEVKHAIDCGAELSPIQFGDTWLVLFDPAGHPFCIEEMSANG
jgi:catechol 2,3-dioxygenase-like lactoylglutathione lyase family enzyme